jgi:hypothetical protein
MDEFTFLTRVLIGFIAMVVSYGFVFSMLLKYEGGLFVESLIPETVSPAMRRARRFFLTLVIGTLATTIAASYGLSLVMSHESWFASVRPVLIGVCFSMLYATLTRYDRIRPREGK